MHQDKMLKLSIPGNPGLKIENLVLDYNGTLAIDGMLIPGVREKICDLAKQINVHILTSDTHGTVRENITNFPVKITILSSSDHTREKESFIKALGYMNTIAIGNGLNDHRMLDAAAIGFAVIQAEGAAAKTLQHADLVFTSIFDAFECMLSPRRLIASLRR